VQNMVIGESYMYVHCTVYTYCMRKSFLVYDFSPETFKLSFLFSELKMVKYLLRIDRDVPNLSKTTIVVWLSTVNLLRNTMLDRETNLLC
jgi:hypothetical protein